MKAPKADKAPKAPKADKADKVAKHVEMKLGDRVASVHPDEVENYAAGGFQKV